jgi:hypothetical protein
MVMRILRYTLPALLLAAGPVSAWTARYGSSTGDVVPTAVQADAFGNIYVTGTTNSADGTDYVTLKYDSTGTREWDATFDWPGTGDDVPSALAVDTLGRVYVTGTVTGTNGLDYGTVCYSADGEELWNAAYDGDSTGDDYAVAVVPDNNGGCFVAGSAYMGTARGNDIVCVAWDSLGTRLWTSAYNGVGRGDDRPTHAAAFADGSYLMVGASAGLGDSTWMVLLRISNTGRQTWFDLRRPALTTIPRALHFDHGGNFYITASADFDAGTGWDAWTVMYEANLTRRWASRFNTHGSPHDHGVALSTDLDTNLYVAVLSFPEETRLTIAGYTHSGGITDWVSRTLSPDSVWVDCGVVARPLGGFTMTGSEYNAWSGWDYFAAGYDTIPELQWEATYNGPGGDDVMTACTAVTWAGFALTGRSRDGSGNWDAATLYWPMSGPGITELPVHPTAPRLSVRPNPASTVCHVRLSAQHGSQARLLELIDAAGRTVQTQVLDRGESTTLSVAGLAPGVYFVRVNTTGDCALLTVTR